MNDRRIRLTPGQRDELMAAASACYPEECSGLLVGRHLANGDAVVVRVVPAANCSPEDRRTSYAIDPRAILATRSEAVRQDESLIGFYHSHPEGGDRPSARDCREAWQEMAYLIVSRGVEIGGWGFGGDGQARRLDVVIEASREEVVGCH